MRSVRILGLLMALSGGVLAQSFNFLPGTPYPAGNGPLTAASGDFNGDGKLDLAVGNAASQSISIFLGNGKGGFTPATPIALPNCVVGFVASGDFNHDGITDLLAICQFQSTVWVVPGLANGSFGTPIATTVPDVILFGYGNGIFQTCVVADFNDDGIPDLVIALTNTNFSLASGQVALLLGKGDGTFQPPSTVLTATSAFVPNVILAADFNRDGNQDLLIAGGPTSDKTAQAGVEMFFGNGKGGFQSSGGFSLPSGFAAAGGILADLNNDHIPDLVLVQGSITGGNRSGDVSVYLGKGDGTFQELSVGPALDLEASGLLAVDLRGTGNLDLVAVAAATESTTVEVCGGNGDGTFQTPATVAFASGWEPWFETIVAGDWNGDGLTDLAFTSLPLGFQQSGSGSGNPQQNAIDSLEALPAGDLVVILNGITPAPALAVSKAQLQFAYVAGGTAPSAQSVAISNSGTGTLNWTATSDSSWLAVSPASGTGAANLSITISPTGLTPASYMGHIRITASGAANSPQSVTVTLTITAPSTTPVITAVVNGASFQPGIESGSWVTILGSNLSNTNPGRTWKASEIVDGNLPQSLDGTSVTIDGKPAYVYYISPGQLNVQAPTDSATGNVAIVVTNNSQTSAAFNAQLDTASPAFFLYPGTSNPIVSHFPDYALVGTSGAPAHPGDVLILWATGFGPTNPTAPAGVVVAGAPAAATLPSVTVGAMQVPVSAAVLTPGSAGLYQIAIQLPSIVPAGTLAIQASVGGAASPAGTTIYVSAQ